MKRPILYLAAFSTIVGVIPAADATVFSSPGLDCVSDEIVTAQLLQYGGQMAFNTSTSAALGVWCPITRRVPDTTSITNLYVTVNDGANNAQVSCVAQSCNNDQSTCTATNPPVKSGTTNSFTGKTELNLGSIVGYSNGSLSIQCILPKITNNQASTVLQYRWDD